MNVLKSKTDLRTSSELMQASKLGTLRPTSLSFTNILIRRMLEEKWKIRRKIFQLDDKGYGEAMYRVDTPQGVFTFIVISSKINEAERSDRVIAQRWDVTFALSEGEISSEKMKYMKSQLPRQEHGRGDFQDLVWSRANKSERVFNYVINCLANGKQPNLDVINEVGYLLRTTAVYGNGKFGIAPYEKIKEKHTFRGPYQAQLFAVYMLRQFSFELVEHIAKQKNDQAIKLQPRIKRFIGIGNATGLGMVPYIINHPKLLHQWILIREKAILRVRNMKPNEEEYREFIQLLRKASVYFNQSKIKDSGPFESPDTLAKECEVIEKKSITFINDDKRMTWGELITKLKGGVTAETEELLYTLLLEIYVEEIHYLENSLNVEEDYKIIPDMKIGKLKQLIEDHYNWVFQYDFTSESDSYYFWYRSIEKEEPRIGVKGKDIGEEKAMPLNIAEQVQQLYDSLKDVSDNTVTSLYLLNNPEKKWIVKRIQSLAGLEYAEVQTNVLARDFLPINLLRCKLALLGAERYDPKSNLWVRVTFFQGAPLIDEIETFDKKSWLFPEIPVEEE